jgi:hypothetical protein
MNNLRIIRILIPALVFILSGPAVRAQHVETRVENAEVVYVEGSDLIVKLPTGEVRQFEVPDSSRFTVDGKDVTVPDLKAGMMLTATITTAAPPKWVDTVEVIEVGTVWRNVGNSLIITTPKGENRMYRIPAGGKVIIEGKEHAVAQLHEGDKITATVVKITPETGNPAAVVHKAPRTPARVGALLIDEGATPPEPSGMWGTSAIIILVLLVLLTAGLILWVFLRKKKG